MLNQPYSPGTWYHTVISWNGSSASVKVNNQNISAHSQPQTVNMSADTYLGIFSDEVTQPFNGQIKEFKWFAQAVSDDVTQQLYELTF
jgi:hypothetical protein